MAGVPGLNKSLLKFNFGNGDIERIYKLSS